MSSLKVCLPTDKENKDKIPQPRIQPRQPVVGEQNHRDDTTQTTPT